MNTLKEIILELDNPEFDYGENFQLSDKIKAVIDANANENLPDIPFIKVEHEMLNINVSIKSGITAQFSQGVKTKTGEEILYQWPDIRGYKNTDFEYMLKRFNETKNNYVKYKYGMVLFLSDKKKDNVFVAELLTAGYELMQAYLNKSLDTSLYKDKHYMSYLVITSRDVFGLALQRKTVEKIAPLYKSIKDFIYNTLCNWQLKGDDTRHIVYSYTRLIHENFSEFKDYNLNVILDKNWEAVVEERKKYNHGAIDLAKNAAELAKKLKTEI